MAAAPGMLTGASPPNIENLLKKSLTQFTTQSVRTVIEQDKVAWNAKIRRNELYYRSLQSLLLTANQNGLVDYTPIGRNQPMQVASQTVDNIYDYVLNFYQGDVDTFIAVLGARAPNGQAQARDLSNESEIRLKMKADRVNSFLDSHWDIPRMHQQLVRGLALYGTMFSYTRYAVNPRKYGITQKQQFETQAVPMGQAYYQCGRCGTETPAETAHLQAAQTLGLPSNTVPCQGCGNPVGPENLVQPDTVMSLVPSGTIPYANGSVECSILHGAYMTLPTYVPNLEDAPWGCYETAEDKGAIIHAYPELRQKAYMESYSVGIDAGAAMGRYTRELITSVDGVAIPRTRARWLHSRIWLTPATYEYLPGDQNGQLRDWVSQQYPDGMMAPMVNGEILCGQYKMPDGSPSPNRVMNERMVSVWAACKPKPSEMIYSDPYFECMIQGQDTVNDCVSMLIEQAMRSNPITIADPEILDPEMLNAFNSIPGEFKFAKAGSVGSLDKGFFRVPAAELNEVLIKFIDKYIAWCREITGITPALFGGQEGGPEKTARQYEIMRNQAMMKLNTPWAECRQFWSRTRENGISQAAKYSNGALYSKDSRGNVTSMELDGVWDLMQGGWYIECEESTPQTIGQRRDFVMNALTMPPEAQHLIGLQEPDNIVHIQEAIGMSDWEAPGYKAVMRLNGVISQLSTAQPIPGQSGPPDPMTGAPGQPGPDQPSIPFEPKLFDPSLAVKVVQGFLLSDRGETLERSNPSGYQNIMAYLDQVHAAMPPPPPDQPKISFTADLQNLTQPAQQAVMQAAGLNMPPGQLAAVPPPPKASHTELLPNSGSGGTPHNPLAAPPPGGAAPSDLTAKPPVSGLTMPPPGVLQ